MRVRSVCCLSRWELIPRDAPVPSLPFFPFPSVTRSREKTHAITHDIYRLHVAEAQQAWHRAKLHVEGVETSRQSDQLGNVIPPNTRSHEKTHAITHDIYRLHVEGAVRSAASCRAQPHTEGAPRAAATIRQAPLRMLSHLLRGFPTTYKSARAGGHRAASPRCHSGPFATNAHVPPGRGRQRSSSSENP